MSRQQVRDARIRRAAQHRGAIEDVRRQLMRVAAECYGHIAPSEILRHGGAVTTAAPVDRLLSVRGGEVLGNARIPVAQCRGRRSLVDANDLHRDELPVPHGAAFRRLRIAAEQLDIRDTPNDKDAGGLPRIDQPAAGLGRRRDHEGGERHDRY